MKKNEKTQMKLLEDEIYLLLDNLERLKEYQKECESQKYVPYNSLVVGEIKHRMIALKQRLTICSKISTYNLLKSKHYE